MFKYNPCCLTVEGGLLIFFFFEIDQNCFVSVYYRTMANLDSGKKKANKKLHLKKNLQIAS